MSPVSLFTLLWISVAPCLPLEPPDNAASRATYSDVIEQLSFKGASSYSQESMRASLKSVPRLQHRLNDPADLKLVRDACQFYLTEGYRNEGYLDVSVEAVVLDGKINVSVTEGPLYTKGAIVIEGLSSDEARQLEGALSKDSVNFQPPILGADDKISKKYIAFWQKGTLPGKPEGHSEHARALAQAWLADEGYGFATVKAATVKVPQNSTVELRLVIDKGTRTPISEVRFEGLERHTAEEVKQFLALPAAFDDSDRVRRDIRDRLLSSGRFYTVHVWPDAPFAPDQAVPLNIRVQEYTDIPRLSEPLGEEQQAIVNLANWLSRWHLSDVDLSANLTMSPERKEISKVFSVTRMFNQTVWGDASPEMSEISFQISPEGNAVLTIGSSSRGIPNAPRTVWVGQESSGVYFHGSRQSFGLRNSDMGLAVAALFRVGELDERGEPTTLFNSGFDMSTGRRPAFGFEVSFPPAVLLGAIESVSRISDEVFELRLQTDGTIVQFVPDTGHLIKIWQIDEDCAITIIPQKDAVRDTVSALPRNDLRDAQKDEVFLPLVRFLTLQYAHDLKKQGLADESEILLTMLSGSHWEELQRELSRADGGKTFPSSSSGANAMAINPLNPLEGFKQKAMQEKMFWINGEQPIAALPEGESVSDQQIVDTIESILQEHPSGIAFLTYMTRWIRGLSPSQMERFCQAVEQGEFVNATRGLNSRPLFQVVRTEPVDDPSVLRRRLIEFAWTFWLSRILKYDVVETNGKTLLRWTAANTFGAEGELAPSTTFLSSSIEQLLPETDPGAQPAQLPQLKNPFLPISNTSE